MIQPHRGRNVRESPVAIIVIERGRVRLPRILLAPDKQIEQAVVVEVAPGRGLCRICRKQAGLLRDVVKRAVPVVAQQRHRVFSVVAEPAAAQN